MIRLPPVLETSRLRIRTPQLNDANALFSWASDPEVTRFLGFRPHRSTDDSLAVLRRWIKSWTQSQGLVAHCQELTYLVEHQGRPIGSLSVHAGRLGLEIGYALSREVWGRGFMPEAVSALSETLLALGAVRVMATAHVDNHRSQRVLEKVGFVREGRLERYFYFPNLGSFGDGFLYARTAPKRGIKLSAMRTDLTVEEALNAITERVFEIQDIEEVALEAALGRTLAKDLAALVDHPDVDNTAVDGYAARAADTLGASPDSPVRLKVIGEAPAGRPFEGRVGPGEAVAIYTGAPLPEGADAVVAVEDTRREGDEVLLFSPASPKDIRPKGDDYKKGEVLLKKGTVVSPGRVGLAAGMGHARLPVIRKPRVGILSTGDEVAEPGEPLPPGGVYNSNSYALAAMVQEAGGEPVLLGRVDDRLEDLKNRIGSAGRLDLLLTSGGVSMGEYDLVRKLLEREGDIHFWKVRLRPGGPLLFAHWQRLPLLGLPGNPVSAMVTFFLFGRPALFKMLGRTDPPYRKVRALAEERFKGAGHKVAFRRAILSYDPESPGGFRARSTGSQSSGVLRSMAIGNALVVVPPNTQVSAGDVVEAILLTPEQIGND